MVAEHAGAAPRSARPRSAGVLERLCFAAVAVYITLLAISFATGFWLVDKQGRGVPTDFLNVWAAGRLVLEGQAAAAYDWAIHERVEYAGVGYDFGGYYGWHYPPAFLFVAAALACLPYAAALVAWMALTLPLYVLTIRRILGDGIGYLAACAFPAALWNTAVGQNGFLTATLFGAGLAALPRRPVLAGLCFGLLTYKPQFGLLIPIALVAGLCWRAIAVAAATALVLHGVAWVVFGAEPFVAFLENLATTNQAVFAEGRAHLDKMQSLYGLLRALGSPATIAWTAQAVLSAAASIAVAVAWRAALPHALKAAALAVGALLASPYVYIYDQVLLAVPIAFLLQGRVSGGVQPIEWMALAAAGLLILTFPAWDLPTGWLAVVIVAGLVGRAVAQPPKPVC